MLLLLTAKLSPTKRLGCPVTAYLKNSDSFVQKPSIDIIHREETFYFSSSPKLPYYICFAAPGVQPCPRALDLPQYDRCVVQQLNAITPYLAKGIPSLKLPALDPLFLPSLTVDRNLDSLKIKANMSQIRVYGATNFVISDLKANPNDLSVRLKVQLPHVHVNGDYDVQGRLLLLPLNGAGSFKGNFSEYTSGERFVRRVRI